MLFILLSKVTMGVIILGVLVAILFALFHYLDNPKFRKKMRSLFPKKSDKK